jgi:uncharacterized protein (TIGR03437 family)
LVQAALAAAFLISGAQAQLITRVDAIPNTGKPPVVFLNGYQSNCGSSSFQGTFANSDQLLQRDGRVALFFDNCSVANRPAIEELGSRFGAFLESLRYEGGSPVSQVDVVAHSMGGLIVRSYLSGKQSEEGVFVPPPIVRIRKAVFIATPHFGTAVTLLLGAGNDRQTAEMQMGSAFVFDLATWNQGTDDLRGVDAISVLGDAGNGLIGTSGFDDAVTSLTSGSLDFILPNRTRILPYCHTDGLALVGCKRPTSPIAQMDSTEHLTAQILLSFLNDTETWRTIGQSPAQHEQLSKRAGLLIRSKDATDRTLTPVAASIAGLGRLEIRSASQIAFSDYVPASQPVQLTLELPGSAASLTFPLTTGSTRAITFKPAGPSIAAIYPSAAAIYPRAVAPGSLISIYGSQLRAAAGDPEVTVGGRRATLTFANETQVNTLVPEDASGLIKVNVKNATGEQTVNVLVEAAVPAIFAAATNAITGVVVTRDSPLHAGDYVALYLTGLGRTTRRDGLDWADLQPEVVFGGQPCTVTYAGRAPGYPGLDQINCRLASTSAASDAAEVQVLSGARFSNVTTLPVR